MRETFDIILIGIAAACWAGCTWYRFRNRTKNAYSFWGAESWVLKYKTEFVPGVARPLLFSTPDNWYYKLFRLDYLERFPLSATLFVFITDGYHLLQWIMIKAIIGAAASSWLMFFILWAVWTVCFNIIYVTLKK